MQTRAACTGTGSAPSYSHSAGDQFVFKQGDSWPNACFDINVQAGGSAGNPDVYTYDPTWGTPGGTKGNLGQTVGTYQFTAGGSVINGADGWNDFIYSNNDNITFNGMELTGMTWSGSGGAFGNVQMFQLQDSQNTTISNIYAHGWSHSGASSDELEVVAGRNLSPFNAGSRVTGSVFDGAGAADSGEAVYAIALVDNNIIRNMSNGVIVGFNAVVHDNLIGPINLSFDPSDHENCIEPDAMPGGQTSVNYIYNNVWHDCSAVGILTQGGAPSSGAEIDYLWNNVAYVGSTSNPPIPFQFDAVSTNNGASEIHAWNNTVYGGSGLCMRTIGRGNGNFRVIDLRNNHCISDQGLISLGTGANTLTNSTNVVVGTSAASSQGLASSGSFAFLPSSGLVATLAGGANLMSNASGNLATLALDTTYGGTRSPNSRPASGAWDIGAYQHNSSGTSGIPAPPTNVKVVSVQ
ncbi:MAG TPA: hypothetical protein VGI34_01770 [Candidatus Acidoferrales bacterium]|jgi:hypothetical protein